MQIYTFTYEVEDTTEAIPFEDRLFKAGGSDTLVHTKESSLFVTFDRFSTSLAEAERTAHQDLVSAGVKILRKT